MRIDISEIERILQDFDRYREEYKSSKTRVLPLRLRKLTIAKLVLIHNKLHFKPSFNTFIDQLLEQACDSKLEELGEQEKGK